MVTPELINFIRSELNKGKTRPELEKELFLAGGWKTTDVAEAFRAIDGVAMPMYKKVNTHKGRGWVVLVIFLLGGAAGWWVRDRQQFFTILRFPTATDSIQESSQTTALPQSRPDPSGPFTQVLAESLVQQQWGAYIPGEGMSFSVTSRKIDEDNYQVLAVYGQADDSVSTIKKQGTATLQNGTWILSTPTVTTVCHPGREQTDPKATAPCI